MSLRGLPLAGIISAIPTPLDSRGQVARQAVNDLVDRLIDGGIAGVAPLGGTGEFTALSSTQRRSMVEVTIEACAGRVPVIAGVLFPGLNDVVEAANAYTKDGADALMVVTPYYYRPTQQGIVEYFARLTEQVDNDLVLYEIPYRTGVSLTAETASELARMTRVVAIKACNLDLAQQLAVVRAAAQNMTILTGEEDVFPLHVAMGATGGILSTSNLFPRLWNEILSHAQRGDVATALALHAQLQPAIDTLFAEPNPSPIKAALNHFYDFPDQVLPPLLPASESLRRQIADVLTPLAARERSLAEAR